MGEPYRYLKKFVKIGNSLYVLMPAEWLNKNKEKFRKMKEKKVIVEVYDDRLIILPAK